LCPLSPLLTPPGVEQGDSQGFPKDKTLQDLFSLLRQAESGLQAFQSPATIRESIQGWDEARCGSDAATLRRWRDWLDVALPVLEARREPELSTDLAVC
jgi:hypothetical protein